MWIKVLCVVAFRVLLNTCRAGNPRVTTDAGIMEGVETDGAYSFRGIPFAEPPVGELRWKPPVPFTGNWTGVFNAQNFGEVCYQPYYLDINQVIGSEDCLFVNVWTPTLDPTAKLPVMVWIHGGCNVWLSGNWPDYSPSEKLAYDTNVVYVSMNYRLQAFGFMALDLISESSPTNTSGNYGLMDQIEALKWVQKKISYFGGDPNKVTVIGQSSGATDIYALLASKLAEGLFNNVWMSSGSPVLSKTTAEASKDNLFFLHNTGCTTLACLKSLSPENITRAIPWHSFPYWTMEAQYSLPKSDEAVGALPVVDGYVLEDEPRKAWRRYKNDVPILIGSTAQELDFSPQADIVNWTWTRYNEEVKAKLSTFSDYVAETALLLYPAGEISPEYQYTTMCTDVRVNCALDIISMEAALNFRSPIYRYVTTAWPSKPTSVVGFPFQAKYAFHCIDFLAYFDTLRNTINPLSPSDIKFQRNIRKAVLSFVRNGKPSARWGQFEETTVLLSERIEFVDGYNFYITHQHMKYSYIIIILLISMITSRQHYIEFIIEDIFSPVIDHRLLLTQENKFGEEMWIKVLCVVAFSVLLNTCRAENPRVTTDCGDMEGVEKDGAYSFRGIPFAEPPVGELRWKAPVPFTGNCTGVFNAQNFGEECYQPHYMDHSRSIGSEDCLFVNVWTPTLDPTAKLPVMVWIHGGFNVWLSGNWPDYSPSEKLAYDTNVVYVSMNYRLQAFGFMALDLISESSPTNTSGNYGLMDQIEALKWVQNKISYFGGDPNKVTIIGQSSGGTDAYALLASKLAEGLFVNVWMSSTSPVLSKTTAEASEDNLFFLNNTGCTTLACLKSLPPENITRAIPWFSFPNWGMEDQLTLPKSDEAIGALPVVDGYVLDDEPRKAWRRYKNDVPILMGSTAQELDFAPPADIVNWTWTRYNEEVKAKLSTFSDYVAETALLLYPAGEISPEYQFTTMGADIRLNCGLDVISMGASLNFRSPIYRYVSTAWPSKPTSVVGFPHQAKYAFHAMDFLAYFDTLRNTINPLSPSDMQYQRNIRKAVLSFVRTGKPSARWGRFEEMTALLSERIEFVDGYHVRECQFWLNNGFFNYAWLN
ncbi:hypothetical protein ScPMuIL_012349 [Solemya velum]